MDETPGFDAHQLQALVLDEADRILDMGFAQTLDAILSNLPRERQTLLFSATQARSVRDLARLSLVDPEYLAAHADAAAPTPLKLAQSYVTVELQQKMDVVWSFVKSHLKAKTIIFLSTCKQARPIRQRGGAGTRERLGAESPCSAPPLPLLRPPSSTPPRPPPLRAPGRSASCSRPSASCAPACRCARCTAA